MAEGLRQVLHRYLPAAVVLLVGISGFVRLEPAPYDYALSVVIPLALFAGTLRYSRSSLVSGAVLGTFLLSNGVSFFGSGDLLGSLRYMFITMYLSVSCAFFVGVLTRHGGGAYRWIWRGYLAAGVIAAVLGWLGVSGVPGLERFVWGELRAVAGFKDPNVYGAFLVPVVLYALHRLRWAGGWAVPAWGIAFGLLAAGQVLSLSRGGWLNLLVALAIYGVLFRQANWRTATRVGLGVMLAVGWLAIALAMNPGILAVSLSRTALMEYDQDRFEAQGMILETIAQKPLGIGPGETERVFGYAAHSLYLRVVVENGWLGGLSFGILLGLCLWAAVRSALAAPCATERSIRAVVAAALVGTLVNSLFIDSLHWRHFWLLLALVWG